MPMDFFARQDHARRQTVKLLVLFGISVAVIIAAVYVVAVLVVHGTAHSHGRVPSAPISFWDPSLLMAVAFGTGLVIGLASLYKVAELSSGGEVVAQMMGGRQVDPQTRDPAERRLLNIVEEMSLASGVPVPPVFVMDNEPSINAFAAGYNPNQAVVAVSRGCLDYLTRDELQGVMGHEFSHVLNGDMRLNLRLIGIVFGILSLSIVGYYIMRSAGFAGSSSAIRKAAAATMAARSFSSAWRCTSWATWACCWETSSRPPSRGSASSWPTLPACNSPATRKGWPGR